MSKISPNQALKFLQHRKKTPSSEKNTRKSASQMSGLKSRGEATGRLRRRWRFDRVVLPLCLPRVLTTPTGGVTPTPHRGGRYTGGRRAKRGGGELGRWHGNVVSSTELETWVTPAPHRVPHLEPGPRSNRGPENKTSKKKPKRPIVQKKAHFGHFFLHVLGPLWNLEKQKSPTVGPWLANKLNASMGGGPWLEKVVDCFPPTRGMGSTFS